jgi:Ca2+:H+ antiporter
MLGVSVTALSSLRAEWPLLVALGTCGVCLIGGDSLVEHAMATPWLFLSFGWLFSLIIAASIAVVRLAERLAHRLGEPYGTLILTLAVTTIEVASISAVMLHGENNPELVRDTLFAVIMIILNGMVGLSLLFGGWVHKEQHYNLQGANAYLSVIVPLTVLSLILPDFTRTTPGPTLSVSQQMFLIIVSIGVYGAFLLLQTGRHRQYFGQHSEIPDATPVNVASQGNLFLNTALLLAYLVPVIYMAHLLARPIDYLIETRHAPNALGGLIIALLVATPEAIGAIRAALANQVQRSMNISLGSVLSTIGLTIPAMLILANFTGRHFVLGLEHTDIVMLLLTLFSCGLTFGSGRTNVLQGAVHLLLFASYILLIFQN